jgi:hypothetical protein
VTVKQASIFLPGDEYSTHRVPPAEHAAVLNNLLGREKNVTPITDLDKSLFRRFFNFNAEPQYGLSWAYLTQAVNGYGNGYPLGLKYHNGDMLVPIGYFPRPASGADNPAWHFHLVRPMGDWAAGPHFVQLCRSLRLLSKTHVYVKKLDTEEANSLLNWHEFKPATDYPWHPAAPEEDDTLDEVVVDTYQALRLIENSGKNQVKDHCRRFLNKYGDSVEWKAYNPALQDDAWDVIQGFFTRLSRKPVRLSVPDDYRNMISSLPPGINGEDYFAYILYIKGKPAGFCLAERLNKSTHAGLYANISLHSQFSYSSEYLVIELIKKMYEAGVRTVNFGGSEIPGLHRFKCKFRPIRQEKKHWVVYEP